MEGEIASLIIHTTPSLGEGKNIFLFLCPPPPFLIPGEQDPTGTQTTKGLLLNETKMTIPCDFALAGGMAASYGRRKNDFTEFFHNEAQ